MYFDSNDTTREFCNKIQDDHCHNDVLSFSLCVSDLQCTASNTNYKTGNCFILLDDTVTYDYNGAKDFCATYGMTLAQMHLQEDNTYVKSLGLLDANAYVNMKQILNLPE